MPNFKEIAQSFVEGLEAPRDTPPAAPTFLEVYQAREIDFPILKEGVQAISTALKERFGTEFNLIVSLSPTTDQLRGQGVAPAEFRLQRRGKAEVSLPFEVSPTQLSIAGTKYPKGADDEIAAALKEWAHPYLQA